MCLFYLILGFNTNLKAFSRGQELIPAFGPPSLVAHPPMDDPEKVNTMGTALVLARVSSGLIIQRYPVNVTTGAKPIHPESPFWGLAGFSFEQSNPNNNRFILLPNGLPEGLFHHSNTRKSFLS